MRNRVPDNALVQQDRRSYPLRAKLSPNLISAPPSRKHPVRSPPAGPGASDRPPQALRPPARAVIRELDPALRALPRQEAPGAARSRGDPPVPLPPRHPPAGVGLHAKPGALRPALYRDVLGIALPRIDDVVRARRPGRLPVVLTRREVQAVLAELTGTRVLVAGFLYGSRLRLAESLRLRVKDFARVRRPDLRCRSRRR